MHLRRGPDGGLPGRVHSIGGWNLPWECGLLRALHVEGSPLRFWNCLGHLGPKRVQPLDAIAQRHEFRGVPAGDRAHGTGVEPVAGGGGAPVGGHASGKEVVLRVVLRCRVNPP